MTDEQVVAFKALQALAAPRRLRVAGDQEGFPNVPGRLGQIEWFHEEGDLLAAFTTRRLMRGRLLPLPWVRRHQMGDEEVRVLFPADRLPEVARLLGARRRRTHGASPEVLARARERARALHRTPAGAQDRLAEGRTSHGPFPGAPLAVPSG